MSQRLTKKQLQVAQHKKDVLIALEASLGVVTTACKKAGIERTTFYNYLRSDEAFAANVAELQNVALDFAESSLHKQIQNGVPASTIFYLKTKGKERGYIERSEITGKDGGPIDVTTRVIEPGDE